MRKKLLWIVILIFVIALVLFSLRPQSISAQVAAITRGPVQAELVEDGVTRVRDKYLLTAPITGTLQRIHLRAGDPVKKGQVVATLDWFEKWSVRAPINGRVLRIFQESAGDIEKGKPIMEVGDPSNLEVVLDLLTEKVSQVRPGQEVVLEKWGGEIPLQGLVERIEPSAFTKISSLGVEEQRTNVIVKLTAPKAMWKNLGDNYHLEGRILLEKKESVLKIPRSALFRVGTSWAVYKLEKNRARETTVKLGIFGPEEVEALEGNLQEDDRVILYPSQEIQNGTRISPQK